MKKCIVFVLVISLFASGCGMKQVENISSDEKQEEKIQIGMCFDSFVIERWQRDRDVFVSTAKEYGAEVNVQNANGDVEEQIEQIEYFIDKKMDVIVIISIDGDRLKNVVQKAKGQGIKIICYDRIIKNADADLYISFDNETVGRMMAQALVQNGLQNKKVIMLQGPVTDYNVELVKYGFMKVMDIYHIEIIDSINADGWRPEIAGNYIYDNSIKVNRADGIMCGNDSLASQVVHSLSEKRLAGKIAVVGQDADLEACQRIVEGTQIMTVYKSVEKLAQTAAEYAVILAKGGDLSDPSVFYSIVTNEGNVEIVKEERPANQKPKVKKINDGTYDIPYVVLEPVSVNKNNIDEVIINSGFHLKEDVYLNRPLLMPE